MTPKDIKYLLAESIGAQIEDKELVFRVLTKKITNQLKPGEAVEIKSIGTFNMPKTDPSLSSSQDKIVFIPSKEVEDSDPNSHFTRIPIAAQKESNDFSADNFFDIGVSKPLATLRNLEDEEGKVLTFEEINEKIDDLISSSETITDYNIWNEPKENDGPVVDTSEDEVAEIEVPVDKVEENPDITNLDEAAGFVAPDLQSSDEIEDPFELPDFKSMENDFIDEVDSSVEDERIEIVSEDDIITPGFEKDEDIGDEIDDESNETEVSSEPDEVAEITETVEETEEMNVDENLNNIFDEYEIENKVDDEIQEDSKKEDSEEIGNDFSMPSFSKSGCSISYSPSGKSKFSVRLSFSEFSNPSTSFSSFENSSSCSIIASSSDVSKSDSLSSYFKELELSLVSENNSSSSAKLSSSSLSIISSSFNSTGPSSLVVSSDSIDNAPSKSSSSASFSISSLTSPSSYCSNEGLEKSFPISSLSSFFESS